MQLFSQHRKKTLLGGVVLLVVVALLWYVTQTQHVRPMVEISPPTPPQAGGRLQMGMDAGGRLQGGGLQMGMDAGGRLQGGGLQGGRLPMGMDMDDMDMGGMKMDGMGMEPNDTGQVTAMLTPQSKKLSGLQLAIVKEQTVEKVIRAAGRVAYDERRLTQINLKVAGWIETLLVNFTGQVVKKDEPLLTLYAPDLFIAQKEYLLAKKIEAVRPILAQERESGGGLLLAARQKLLLLGMTESQIRLLDQGGEPEQFLTINAPMEGVIIRREGMRGMYVTPGMPLYEMADLSVVWVMADVHENEIASVHTGQKARVAVMAYPEETFDGKVGFIDPFLNSKSRTVGVRVELVNPELKLKPEMFAEVTLAVGGRRGRVIPETAVIDSGTQQIVFVDGGKETYLPREIKAVRFGNRYLVLEGLEVGERVVTAANFLVDSESKLMASTEMMGALGMGGIKMEQATMGKMEMGPKKEAASP